MDPSEEETIHEERETLRRLHGDCGVKPVQRYDEEADGRKEVPPRDFFFNKAMHNRMMSVRGGACPRQHAVARPIC